MEIYADKNLVIVEKPAGVPAQPDKTGDADLQSAVAEKYGFAGLVHRLDRPVGGLMVYALDKKTEAALSRQLAEGLFKKTYLAVCCGVPENKEGQLKNWLVKNQRTNMSYVADRGSKNAKEAVLDYKVLATVTDEKWGELTLLEIALHTGRHHQIRVQLANAGLPLWGDTKYNEAFRREYKSPALFSSRLEFIHPWLKKPVVFAKKPEYEPFLQFSDEMRKIYF